MRTGTARRLFILLCGALVMLATGCKKDEADEEIIEELPPPGGPVSITAGETQGMDITSFDTVFMNTDAFGSMATLSLDLDADLTQDLRIHILTWHSLGQGFQSVMWLKRLNSALRMDGTIETDTLFTRMDSTLEHSTAWTPPYLLTVTEVQGCGLVGQVTTETVYADVFRPRLYEDGEAMDTTNYLDADSIFMTRKPVQYYYPLGPQELNDSTDVLDSYDHLHNCFVIPMGVPQYLGFALESNGTVRKGWLGFHLQAYHAIALWAAAMEP